MSVMSWATGAHGARRAASFRLVSLTSFSTLCDCSNDCVLLELPPPMAVILHSPSQDPFHDDLLDLVAHRAAHSFPAGAPMKLNSLRTHTLSVCLYLRQA